MRNLLIVYEATIIAYRADTRVGVAFVRVSVAVTRLTEAEVDTLNGARVTRVAVLTRQSLVAARASALLHGKCSLLATTQVPLFRFVQ